MAFSVAWDEDAPDGAVITISLLDNYIRQTRIAVRERMEGDPADPTTGIVEEGTWEDGPILKAGAGRFAHGAEADVNTETLLNGRGYFTTDASNGHPKVYHLDADGAVQIAYLNLDGSRSLLGTLDVEQTVEGVTANQRGIIVQLHQTEASYTVTDAIGVQINDVDKGASVTITTLYGLKIDDQTGGGTNYALFTGAGLVRFGDDVTIHGGAGAALLTFENNDGDGVTFAKQTGSDGDLIITCSTALQVYAGAGGTLKALMFATEDGIAAGNNSLTASSTQGYFFIPAVLGPMTGVPEDVLPALSGDYVALVYDTSDDKLKVYDGSWKATAALT